jgi:hypothetical protein
MCDYSLHGIPNRLAVEGDELVVHRFETSTIGLCAACELDRPSLAPPAGVWGRLKQFFEAPVLHRVSAVCVPPGARLILKGIPKHLQREWAVGEEEKVVFTQITAASNVHRDALRLPNGREILLQHIREGLRVQVASLGGGSEMADATFERIDSEFESASHNLR